MKSHVFSKSEFKAFQSGVIFWMDRLGLYGWNYSVEQSPCDDGVIASVFYENTTKKAKFVLTNKCCGELLADEDMERTALHEVLHLLLSDFCWSAAKTQDEFSDSVLAYEHDVINRLLKVIPAEE